MYLAGTSLLMFTVELWAFCSKFPDISLSSTIICIKLSIQFLMLFLIFSCSKCHVKSVHLNSSCGSLFWRLWSCLHSTAVLWILRIVSEQLPWQPMCPQQPTLQLTKLLEEKSCSECLMLTFMERLVTVDWTTASTVSNLGPGLIVIDWVIVIEWSTSRLGNSTHHSHLLI